MKHLLRSLLASTLILAASCQSGTPVASGRPGTPAASYFPTRQRWERRLPADEGMDPVRLRKAVDFALTHETDMPRDFSTQAQIFGTPLGPVPKSRATTNGVIIRHGYIVAEWGDTSAVDPSYSMAKSYLSTILGLTIDRGLIKDIHDPVANLVHDGGYDSPHNSVITWQNHATQTSEWDGTLFGKSSTFIGAEAFGKGEMKPRELRQPGTSFEYNDVRVNRFSLSLLRLWKRPLPDVLKREIMDPIGASSTWVYHAYDNATVDVDGTPMPSVSGGTRWGGGLWMNTLDHARFGLLILSRGQWNGKRIISEAWIREATRQQGVNPEYGYLWWLNTTSKWPAAPATSFAAIGAGDNTIWIDPEHDIVAVWRWHKGDARAEFFKLIEEAIADAPAK